MVFQCKPRLIIHVTDEGKRNVLDNIPSCRALCVYELFCYGFFSYDVRCTLGIISSSEYKLTQTSKVFVKQ